MIQATSQIQKDEYFHAMRRINATRFVIFYTCTSLLFLRLFLGDRYLFEQNTVQFGFIILLANAVYCSLMFWLAYQKQWKKIQGGWNPIVVTISEEGVRYRHSLIDTLYSWRAFDRVVETSKCFLPIVSKQPLVLAKRWFTPEQLEQLRTMLRDNVGNHRNRGFPVLPTTSSEKQAADENQTTQIAHQ